MLDPVKTRILVSALTAMALAAPGIAMAGSPEPFYSSHITKTEKESPGSVVIWTTDSVDTVAAWYRTNIKDLVMETKRSNGGVMFSTKSTAVVLISRGNRFAPDTKVGVQWDAAKYGPYTDK